MAELPGEFPVELDDDQELTDTRWYRVRLSTGDNLDTRQLDGWGPGHPDWDTLGGFLAVGGSWVNVRHIVSVVPL